MSLALALSLALASAPAEPRVILVTLDGARWQDVFGTSGALFRDEHPLMPALWGRVAREGVLFGGPGSTAVTSSPAPVSLPGYQALLVGHTTCADNACPRVTEETLPERLARELSLPPEQVAVFASWSKVARAASSKDGAVLVDAPPDGPATASGPPWDNARYDDVTARKAIAHLELHRPRFLYLALLDMDEHAHDRDARKTADALRAADRTLARIFRFVEALPPAERALTTVIVTADHGRGPGPLWFDHRAALSESRDIFVAAVGTSVQRLATSPVTKRVTQADVRPTIEALFGLVPSKRGGTPIAEIAR